jgi:hypothetical protein
MDRTEVQGAQYRIKGSGSDSAPGLTLTTHTAMAALTLRVGVKHMCGGVAVFSPKGAELSLAELLRLAESELR